MKTEKWQCASLEIPLLEAHVLSAADYVVNYASRLGIDQERSERLRTAAASAMSLVMRINSDTRSEERMRLDVFESEGRLYVEVLNRGVPILTGGEGDDASPHSLHGLSKNLDRFSIENLGREGQTIVLAMRLGEVAAERSLPAGQEPEMMLTAGDREIEIREIRPGEEIRISQLFYHVYGYNYINDFIYYPEKIRDLVQSGSLISMVAIHPSGKFLGHVGLRKWNSDPPVFEPCLGVTHPAVKSKGLFRQLFEKLMQRVQQMPMQYCFLDFVTNHEFSQKLVEHYGPCPTALFVGCQSKHYQAKLEKLGMGEDPKETDRYTLLFGVLPQVRHPFGREIMLPNNLGEMLGFVLKPLNLTWIPTPRFEMLASRGEYQTHLQPLHNSVCFDLFDPGRDAVDGVLRDWRRLLRVGYQYGALDVPIGVKGLGQLYDILSEHGFFVAGFIPYHCSARLGFRFQTIGPTKLDFGEIRVFSERSKKLLRTVRENYEKNQE